MKTKTKTKARSKGKVRKEYVPARARVRLTPGDAVRVAREAQEMTQAELAAATGIGQPAISAIESGRRALGADRAEKIAIALKVHPAVLLWPQWGEDEVKRAG